MKNCLYLFGLLLLFSCKKTTDNPFADDFLVFGHFYGFCGGEQCIEIFKLGFDRLLEDTRDDYPRSDGFYQADYQLRSYEDFLECQELMTAFPSSLWEEDETIIGQPDAGDWGGIYVEYKYQGKHQFWLLDQQKSNVPEVYHPFIELINAKIQALQ